MASKEILILSKPAFFSLDACLANRKPLVVKVISGRSSFLSS
nr:hypothetical protein [Pedobacter aquae]